MAGIALLPWASLVSSLGQRRLNLVPYDEAVRKAISFERRPSQTSRQRQQFFHGSSNLRTAASNQSESPSLLRMQARRRASTVKSFSQDSQ